MSDNPILLLIVLYDLITCMVIISLSIFQPHASNIEDTMIGHRKPFKQGLLNKFTTLIGIFKQFVTLLLSNLLTITDYCYFHLLKYCNF